MAGKTETGELVITNVFRLMESQGIHLTDVLLHFKQNNLVMDWVDFYESAIKANWNIRTVMSKLEDSLTDVYGKEYRDAVLEKMRIYISIKSE